MIARFRTPATLALATALALGAGVSRAAAQDTSAARTSPAPAAAKEPALTAAQRQAYVGTYAFTRSDGRQMSLRIYDENGALHGEPTGQTPKRLVYLGDAAFQPEGLPDLKLTFTLVDGRATKLSFRQNGTVFEDALVK
jgi:hypothetical protein